MRKSFLFMFVASLTLACCANYRIARGCAWLYPGNASATISVKLPEGAKLFVDDEPTTSTGEERTFISPPIPFGRDFEYTLRLEVAANPEKGKGTNENENTDMEESDRPRRSTDQKSDEPESKPSSEDKKPKSESEDPKPATVVVTRKITVRAGVMTTVDFGDITIRGEE